MSILKSKVTAWIMMAVICMSVLFHSNNKELHALKTVETAETLQKQAEQAAAVYQAKVDSLTQANDELEQQVSDNANALQHAKQANRLLENKVKILTEDVQSDTNTIEKLSDCDSLAKTVTELSVSNENKDSLYETMQTVLKAEIINRDSVISDQQQGYNSLKVSFEKSLSNLDTTQNNCRFLQKQLNHQVIKKKALSAGIIALSGFTLFSLLRH